MICLLRRHISKRLHKYYMTFQELALLRSSGGQHITTWRSTLLEELTVAQLLYNSQAFYGTLKFITLFKSLPLVPVQNQMNPVYTLTSYLRSILTPPHLRIGHPCGLFLSGFSSQNIVCNSFLSLPCYTPWSSQHMAYYPSIQERSRVRFGLSSLQLK
jgi:hypothetical protein